MNLYIYTGATDLTQAAVTAANNLTAVTEFPALVYSDTEPLAIRFTTGASGALPSWANVAGNVIDVTVGELGSTGSDLFAATSDFTFADNVYSGEIFLGTPGFANWVAGRRNGRGWLNLQVRHTDPDGHTETLAVLTVPAWGSIPATFPPETQPVNYATYVEVLAAKTAAEAAQTAAETAEANAELAEANAETAQQAAEAAEINAAASETNAAASAQTATTQANAASQSAADADADRILAQAAAIAAQADASTAANAASDAQGYRDTAVASAAAAQASELAAASSEANAAQSETNAGASATAAAASAATALLTAAGQYLGGSAGNAVPATATNKGDYYRITSAGTSQSVTWAIGDMAVYNGTSGSWTRLSGILPYATDAEARAGTDTTKAQTPASGNARALHGDLTRVVRDCLFSDGATSNRRGEATFGTVGAVVAMPISIPFELEVPTANPSANWILNYFGPNGSSAATSDDGALLFFLGTSGQLTIRENAGSGSGGNRRLLEWSGFRAAYSGLRVRGIVVFSAPNTTTAPTVYVNGADVSANFTPATNGTPPNWMATDLVLTKYLVGLAHGAGRFMPHAPILGALTAAEVLEWTQTGRLPTWCEVGTGSAVDRLSGIGDFETGVGSLALAASGSTTIARTAAVGVAGSYGVQAVTDGSNSNWSINTYAGLLNIGRKYRITFTAKSDTGTPTISSDTFSGLSQALTTSFVTYTFDLVCVGGGAILKRSSAAGTTIVIDNLTILELGPLAKWEIQPVGTCYDAGDNEIPLLLTAGITPITNKRDWVLQGSTNTNGNQQLLGASVFVAPYDSTRHMLDTIEVNGASTATVGVGSASGGAQYVTAAAIASGRNRRTLVTPVVGTANIWISSNATDVLRHTIRGHLVD